ncbi:MAG: DUF669 domain-containing protein [Bryobacteraceae bacterium]
MLFDQRHPDRETEIDLSRFDDEFAQASPVGVAAQSVYEDIPDGFYDASVESVDIGQTANTGNPMIVWRLRIRGPQCEGRAVTKVRVITHKTLGYVKRDLEQLGLCLDRLSDLPARCEEMVDRDVRIYKRSNPERRWTEVYFVSGRKEPGREAGRSPAWSTGTDDDVPF